MKLKDNYGTVWTYEPVLGTKPDTKILLTTPSSYLGHPDEVFGTSLHSLREGIRNGVFTVLEGSFDENVPNKDTVDNMGMLEIIKDFTKKYNVDITVSEGVYVIKDCDTQMFYEASDDKVLAKIMEALITLEDAFAA